MTDHDSAARRRAARLTLGLCAQCGLDSHVAERTRCKRCLLLCAKLSQKRRRLANRIGKCQACLRRKQAPGRGRRCARCADRYNANRNQLSQVSE